MNIKNAHKMKTDAYAIIGGRMIDRIILFLVDILKMGMN